MSTIIKMDSKVLDNLVRDECINVLKYIDKNINILTEMYIGENEAVCGFITTPEEVYALYLQAK